MQLVLEISFLHMQLDSIIFWYDCARMMKPEESDGKVLHPVQDREDLLVLELITFLHYWQTERVSLDLQTLSVVASIKESVRQQPQVVALQMHPLT